MIVTAKKAETLICPFKLSAIAPANRAAVLCEGRDCMAWQEWNDDPREGYCGMVPISNPSARTA